jgi:hypothetical protein
MKRQSNSGRDSPSKKPKQQALSFVSSSASKPDRATQEEDDARFARELADREGILGALEWDEKRREKLNDKGMSKGKGTASEPKAEPEVDDSGSDDCIIVEEPKQPNTTTASGKAIFASADLQKPSPTSKPKRPSTPGQPRTTSASPGTKPTTFSFFSPAQPVASTIATSSFKSLDTPVYAFNPKTDVDTSRWPSSRLPYSYLTSAFVLISSTKRRLTILRVLTNLLRVAIELDPASLLAVVYLSTNRLGPAHERDLELGIGSQVLGKAIREVSGLTPAALRSLSNKLGDAGALAKLFSLLSQRLLTRSRLQQGTSPSKPKKPFAFSFNHLPSSATRSTRPFSPSPNSKEPVRKRVERRPSRSSSSRLRAKRFATSRELSYRT